MDKKDILSHIHTNLTPEESLYIRMCADADEILQKWWKPKIGDVCIDLGNEWRIWHINHKKHWITLIL